jgi:chromosome partitioning protein
MIKMAIANLKGGVGKSSTTLFLSEHWALFQERKVLVIDLDPQANVSYMLLSRAGVENAENAGGTLPNLIEDMLHRNRQNVMAYVRRASDLQPLNGDRSRGRVSIVPSVPKLWFQQHDLERQLYSAREDPVIVLEGLLTAFLDEIGQHFDCVLLDCPPGFGSLARAALLLADHIVAPTIADYTSMRSLQDFVSLGLQGTLQRDIDHRLHVVVSKYTRTRNQREALDILRRSYRVREPVIPMLDHVQVVAERHATRLRTYAQKYGRPVWSPLKPHAKGLSDSLYRAIFAGG